MARTNQSTSALLLSWLLIAVAAADSDESVLLAKLPVPKPEAASPAPDIASALAALVAAKDVTPSAPKAAPSMPGMPATAPDLASALTEKAKQFFGAFAAPAPQAPPPAAASLASSLTSELAALLLPKQAGTPDPLETVKLTKQYVPIEKDGTTIAYKTAYFGKLHTGGPIPKDFTVVFDTGSAHLVLPSSACQSETCLKHNRYDEMSSLSAYPIEHDGSRLPKGKISAHSVSITFGTGQVSGTFVREKACLGATDDPEKWCPSINMVVANQMSESPFGLFHFDGILGLGLEGLALSPSFSFFGQMVSQRPSMQPQFSVFLARTDEGESSISFGGHDDKKAASDVQWVPVAKPELGYWQVRIHQVRIGNTVLDECADGGCYAILDTGTSLLGAPRQVIRMMHQHLSQDVLVALQGSGEGEGQVSKEVGTEAASKDCRQQEGSLLTFDMGLGSQSITLEPEDYFRPKPFNMTVPQNPNAWKLTCRSLLLPLDLQEPIGPRTFILGEPVLRKYYTIYDWAKRRIGFATANHSQDGENADGGAIGAPQAGSLIAGAPLPRASNQGMSNKSDPAVIAI